MLRQRSRHFLIERRQNLIAQLDDGCFNSPTNEIFDQFQSNKAGADYNRLTDSLLKPFDDAVHIFQVSQREDSWKVHPGQRRSDRLGAGSQNEFVVSFLVSLSTN